MVPRDSNPEEVPATPRKITGDPAQSPMWIDEVIREAQERGDFDDLPGKGRPIPGAGKPDDDLWWVRAWIKRQREVGDDESGRR